jgi:hypothetical protein
VTRRSTALPRGYWGPDLVRPILDKTLTVRVEVDLTELAPGERTALSELIAAAITIQDIAEDQEHHQALKARAALQSLHQRLGQPRETADLLTLYDLNQGPIATTIENELLPFLPVDGFVPGRNVYPWGVTSDELESFFDRHLERRSELLAFHAVVRRTTPAALRRDLATLRRHRVLASLHPGLEERLHALATDPRPDAYYAVPYSVAWAEPILSVVASLQRAATALDSEDRDLAAFLRLRGRDLLTDDNEAGDAAWIHGQFGRLDVVLGAYEVYDDDLFGAKGFLGMAILVRDEPGTRAMRERMRHLQEIENALPTERHSVVRADIPIGSYDVALASGQARSVAAEILPNDPDLIRKYGRKIAMRRNTIVDPDVFERVAARWRAAIVPEQAAALTPAGAFEQFMWHEVGHYLGPDTDRDGRPHEQHLGEDAALVEELKAELVSQFAAIWLHDRGSYDADQLNGILASAILAGLRPVRPLRTQPYPTLWHMELNYFFEQGLVTETADGLRIHFDRHLEVVTAMLREVLGLLEHGTRTESSAFIERYSIWDARHDTIAARLRAVERHRFTHAKYALLEGGE